MKYFIIYDDSEYRFVDELDTIEEVKEKISKIKKDKWLYLERVIWGKEIKSVIWGKEIKNID